MDAAPTSTEATEGGSEATSPSPKGPKARFVVEEVPVTPQKEKDVLASETAQGRVEAPSDPAAAGKGGGALEGAKRFAVEEVPTTESSADAPAPSTAVVAETPVAPLLAETAREPSATPEMPPEAAAATATVASAEAGEVPAAKGGTTEQQRKERARVAFADASGSSTPQTKRKAKVDTGEPPAAFDIGEHPELSHMHTIMRGGAAPPTVARLDTYDPGPNTHFYRDEHSLSKDTGKQRPLPLVQLYSDHVPSEIRARMEGPGGGDEQQPQQGVANDSARASLAGGSDVIDSPLLLRRQTAGDVTTEESSSAIATTTTTAEAEEASASTPETKGFEFGWIKGVFVRCLLNIWGVMLFIRLSWVVGQGGISFASLVILLATAVTVATTMSMSAISTNGKVRGGGAYFMISRSLGPEFGGAIGIIFSLANAVAVALYIVGFAETVSSLMAADGVQIIDGGLWDIRIIGLVTAGACLAIVFIGMAWEAKAQMVLLVVLLIAIADFVIGTFLNPTAKTSSQGFTGYSQQTFSANWGPEYRGEDFFSVFAVFFPAATGILAGANISGDLKDAQKAIPKGTFLAIGVTSGTYLVMAWLVGATVVRDAGTMTIVNATTNATVTVPCVAPLCEYGLLNNFQVMEMVSLVGPLISAGIFAATLSSALTSLVSAPKVFQAVCNDDLFPYISFFGKGSGPNNEPKRGYILAFVIAICFILIGQLNEIALIISNFFLMAYALINYSCFQASFSQTPGWRPTYRFYSQWVALGSSFVCLIVMFVISWWTALITVAVVIFLYKFIEYRDREVNWGEWGAARRFRTTLNSLLRLEGAKKHVKNYRPQFLVLTGPPSSRPELVRFVADMSKNVGSFICAQIVGELGAEQPHAVDIAIVDVINARKDTFLIDNNYKGFFDVVASQTFRQGVRSLLQLAGLGTKVRPNIVVLGYPNKWQDESKYSAQQLREYVGAVSDSYAMVFGIVIIRGSDFFSKTARNVELAAEARRVRAEQRLRDNQRLHEQHHDIAMERESAAVASVPRETRQGIPMRNMRGSTSKRPESFAMSAGLRLNEVAQDGMADDETVDGLEDATTKRMALPFYSDPRMKNGEGTIDVWWIGDDGGLTLLLPHLLSNQKDWSKVKLRLFILASRKNYNHEVVRMTRLLSKFRFKVDLNIVEGYSDKPSDNNIRHFRQLLGGEFTERNERGEPVTPLDPWVLKRIRLGELLRINSRDALLVFVSLPVPRASIPPRTYMASLEAITFGLPPTLLMRGNQEDVLSSLS